MAKIYEQDGEKIFTQSGFDFLEIIERFSHACDGNRSLEKSLRRSITGPANSSAGISSCFRLVQACYPLNLCFARDISLDSIAEIPYLIDLAGVDVEDLDATVSWLKQNYGDPMPA